MSTIVASNLQASGGGGTAATLASINGGPLAGSRNRIINGGMDVAQRSGGAAVAFTAGAALGYPIDRWYGYCTGANVTGQQIPGSILSPGALSYSSAYRITGASGCTSIGLGQRIESLNSYDLAGTTATLSVSLANSLLTTVTWTAYYANTLDSFGTLASPTRTQIATGTFTVNSTVTRYSTNISVPAAASTGIEIVFTVGAQTSGTWTITNVQLEAGTVATAFERRSYGQELALCQRYFETLNGGTVKAAGEGPAGSEGSRQYFGFATTKRAAPTMAYPAANQANCNLASNSATNGFNVTATIVATGTFGYDYAAGTVTASAEL